MTLGEDPGGPRDEGFAFEPRPIGGAPGAGGRRADRLRAWLVVGGAASLVAGALLGGVVDDRGPRSDRPAADVTRGEPRPSAEPRRLATAMPQLVVEDPTRPPSGRVLTLTDGYRWLDLASGSFGDLLPMSMPTERLPDGTFLCACLDAPWSPGDQVMTLRVARLDADGRRLGESGSISFRGVRDGPPSSNVVSVGRTFSDAGDALFAAAAARTASGAWTFELATLPVESGRAERLALGEIGGEPEIRYVAPPLVSVSYDGRYIVVAATIQRGSFRNPQPLERAHWLVRLEKGSPAAAEPYELPPPPAGHERCIAEGFVDTRVYADVCSAVDPESGALVPTVRRVGIDGRIISEVPLSPRPMISANVLVDRTTRSIYAWDPDGHTAYVVDGRTGELVSGGVPAGVLASVGAVNPPDRHFLLNSTQSFVLSPDRSRLYALGAAGGAIDRGPSSTGIWAFDAETLDWIDRWAPVTNYAALGISDDGRRLFASGLSGVTAEGLPSAAEASVTVHDADDGEVIVVAGRLGENFTVRFPPG